MTGFEEQREIIDEYAQRGFPYGGFIPTAKTLCGKPVKIDLIFETDADALPIEEDEIV